MALDQKIEKLDELLKGHINGEVVKYTVTRLTKPGENFLSLILKVDITLKNGDKEEELSTVAKLVPPGHRNNDFFKGLANITFNNEIVWYDQIVPLFEEFEKEYAVEGVTDIYPKFYGGRLSLTPGSKIADQDAVVLLENLKDYGNEDRLTGFNLEKSKTVLTALAKFHGVTMAYRHHKRKDFDEKILPKINVKPEHNDSPDDNFFTNLLEILNEDPECVPLIPRCKETFANDPMTGKETLEFREPWGTTLHDDYWTNNMMLRKTPDGPKVKVVDFQMVMFKSFAVDLLFFIMTSLENSVLANNVDELVRYYYDELIGILKQFKMDTDEYTYESYLKELEIECKGGQFIHALRFVNIIFADRDSMPDVVMEMDQKFFETFMQGKNPRQKEKVWAVTKMCAKKNWI